jgi:pimeloyl-ACP methyl ester carboxylesterase
MSLTAGPAWQTIHLNDTPTRLLGQGHRGNSMRLAAKWHRSWTMLSDLSERGRVDSVRIDGEWVDVVRLGQGEPIVLVPGLAGSWKLLVPLAQQLARHFEVFIYGLRGDRFHAGATESEVRQSCEIGRYARDLATLLDDLGVVFPAVFGVSFGGAVALELAAEYPDRLGALIVHGAEAQFRPTIGSTIARRVLERFPLPNDNRFVNQFFHLLYGSKPEPSPLVDFVVERIWETDQTIMAHRLAELETFDISERLWRIDVPTLVLAGSRDVIIPAARQRGLAEQIAGARFQLLENAGHVGFLTHTTEVVKNVRRHLRRVGSVV